MDAGIPAGAQKHEESPEDAADRAAIATTANENKTMGLPSEIVESKQLKKYWAQRYRLFSLFDKGIKLDHGNLLLKYLPACDVI